ncbi:MAG: TSUP family transporter [Succinivibrio sp.]|nr:TSUP family transporter [Succinivibrio sp.]
MVFDLWQYALVCVMVFAAGFVDAIAGGGGLISIPGYMIAGLPAHFALGTNKLSSTLGTMVATLRFVRQGYILWKLALCCSVAGLVGSVLGAHAAILINERMLKIAMLFIIPATAVFLMRSRSFKRSDTASVTTVSPAGFVTAISISLAIGIYDGIYGPGTGTFLILLFTAIVHLSLRKANGTAKVINLTTNISALIVFLVSGKVMIIMGLIAGVFNMAGNYLGAVMFSRGGAKIVRPMMLTVMGIFMVKVIYELWFQS